MLRCAAQYWSSARGVWVPGADMVWLGFGAGMRLARCPWATHGTADSRRIDTRVDSLRDMLLLSCERLTGDLLELTPGGAACYCADSKRQPSS
jgi:hypothetical protein